MNLQDDESYPEKQYYQIGEVATMLNTSVSKIRFWEIEFDVLRPKKNKKGDRFFTKQDIEYLKVIYHLLKEKGYTIEGAKKQLQQNPEKLFEKTKLLRSLQEIRNFLASLRDQLDKN